MNDHITFMDLIKIWFICGLCVTFFVLTLEYFVKYDRVAKVIAENGELARFESFMRVCSAVIMVVIWPWTVINYLVGFAKGLIAAFKNNE